MSFLRRLFGGQTRPPEFPSWLHSSQVKSMRGSLQAQLDDVLAFENFVLKNDFPIPEWDAVFPEVETQSESTVASIWLSAERYWLMQFLETLGDEYELREDAHCFLLSAMTRAKQDVTSRFVLQSQKRILRMLDGIASLPSIG